MIQQVPRNNLLVYHRWTMRMQQLVEIIISCSSRYYRHHHHHSHSSYYLLDYRRHVYLKKSSIFAVCIRFSSTSSNVDRRRRSVHFVPTDNCVVLINHADTVVLQTKMLKQLRELNVF